MTQSIPRITSTNSVLIVIDVQEKLLAKMPGGESLVQNIEFLVDAAKLLDVPCLVTEQYPKGLGPTVPRLAAKLPANPPAKTAFSCCGTPGFLAELRSHNRLSVVLAGMEAHVCVAQTAMDLVEAGFTVFLPVDAVASRTTLDHDTAIQRLSLSGVVPTTSEAIAFEWVGDASHPKFKSISKLVIDRM